MLSQCDLFKGSQLRDGCLPSFCDTGSDSLNEEKDRAAFKDRQEDTVICGKAMDRSGCVCSTPLLLLQFSDFLQWKLGDLSPQSLSLK